MYNIQDYHTLPCVNPLVALPNCTCALVRFAESSVGRGVNDFCGMRQDLDDEENDDNDDDADDSAAQTSLSYVSCAHVSMSSPKCWS